MLDWRCGTRNSRMFDRDDHQSAQRVSHGVNSGLYAEQREVAPDRRSVRVSALAVARLPSPSEPTP